MQLRKTGHREFFTRMVVLLLFISSIHPYAAAHHYIRINADFSYARDFVRAKTGAPFMENISLEQAQEGVGKGKAESFRSSNGWAPGIGVGYRYKGNKLWFIDAGIGAEYRYRVNPLYDIVDVQADAVDNMNLPYMGHHTWNNREACFQHVGVSVPVMAGVEWKNIYAMVGFRANVDIWGTAIEKGAYTLIADYERYMDPMRNIPGHGFVQNEPYKMTSGASVGWDVRVCAEVGYCLNGMADKRSFTSKAHTLYYLGAFVEYGVIGDASRYRPLLAGIRFTVLLPITEPNHCNCLGY